MTVELDESLKGDRLACNPSSGDRIGRVAGKRTNGMDIGLVKVRIRLH
jgi:hypothetical protein